MQHAFACLRFPCREIHRAQTACMNIYVRADCCSKTCSQSGVQPLGQQRGESPTHWCTAAIALSAARTSLQRMVVPPLPCCVDACMCVVGAQTFINLEHDNFCTNQNETPALDPNIIIWVLNASTISEPESGHDFVFVIYGSSS